MDDYTDAWFVGFDPEITVGVWVGYDEKVSLGNGEEGASVALPIWIDFMREALLDSPVRQRPLPPGTVSVRIDPDTGLLARPGQDNAIFEYFLKENVPSGTGGEAGPGEGSGGTDELLRDIF